MFNRISILVGFLGFLLASLLSAETDTVLILHTNDLHDHIRPDYDGQGGLPFVSGYIKKIKSERDDVIVLDAGDVAEKGDMVVFETRSEMMYKALRRIGYHAGAPGNHEHDSYGRARVKELASLAGYPVLAINLIKEDGTPEFEPSAIFDIDGVKIGVIGMLKPRNTLSLNDEETAHAMAREAERLEGEADLIVAVCHFGSEDCAMISRIAPSIDVFVSGHTHEVIPEAITVEETGALIVQAGSYAEYVGRLELTIDTDTEEIVGVQSELVPMDHHTVPVDVEMLEWVRRQELSLAPEASRVVAWTDKPLGRGEIGQLAAAALRDYSGADIGFCNADQVLRAELPVGVIDVNAIFRTGGQRGFRTVAVELSGAEIDAYLNALVHNGYYLTQWTGFQVMQHAARDGTEVIQSNLDKDKTYRVVMPEREWTSRYQLMVRKAREQPDAWHVQDIIRERTPVPVGYSFTDAVVAYVEKLVNEDIDLKTHVAELYAAGWMDKKHSGTLPSLPKH